ncbi:MAG: SAV_6107 family HEPN domain-containing protein [Jatrophihabitantaceae bacterium]
MSEARGAIRAQQPSRRSAPVAANAAALLDRARATIAEAGASDAPAERFCLAHLAALRTAAALLAERGRPASARRRLVSAWVLIDAVAPEFADWAAYFAAGAAPRAAIEAGALAVVSAREADDQLRSASEFLALVAASFAHSAAAMAS